MGINKTLDTLTSHFGRDFFHCRPFKSTVGTRTTYQWPCFVLVSDIDDAGNPVIGCYGDNPHAVNTMNAKLEMRGL